MITYDDFSKLDIRIATILEAERVPETDKLIKLRIDVGEEEPRTLVAGIAEHTPDPKALVGLQLPILANLEPREIKGIVSQGMILAASNELTGGEGPAFALLHPSVKIKEGSRVR